MSENQDELKAQIKVWLKQQKMTREEFAAECFVSPNTVRNWLARVSIPKDKEALIRLMMEKTEREKELKEAARAHWKPFAVMVNTDDYKLIEKAARKDNMTVEEWAEGILIRDAQERMEHVYPESLRVAEEPKDTASRAPPDRIPLRTSRADPTVRNPVPFGKRRECACLMFPRVTSPWSARSQGLLFFCAPRFFPLTAEKQESPCSDRLWHESRKGPGMVCPQA